MMGMIFGTATIAVVFFLVMFFTRNEKETV